MYMTRVIEISKAENGFVLECRVPLKKDAKNTKTMDCCYNTSVEKQYIAKNEKEVAQLVSDIMPLLEGDYKTEDEFDCAFDEACGTKEKEDGKETD